MNLYRVSFGILLFIPFLLVPGYSLLAQKAQVEMVPDQPYDKYELNIEKGTITFYLSVTSLQEEVPLVVFIHGSGRDSLFSKSADGSIVGGYGHRDWFDVGQEKCRILIVEKPGVRYLQAGESRAFDEKFSLESFSQGIVEAIHYVLQNEKIDKQSVLVAGHSEGGVVASRVARMMGSEVQNVAILAGEGPSQLYSLYRFAEDGTFFNEKEHDMPSSEARLRYVTDQWKSILDDPQNTDKKFWGFTYLRWSSMLRTSVMDELRDFGGRILLVQGTADKSVHPESATVAYATLMSKGKQVELLLVDKADHSFNILDKPEAGGWKKVIGDVFEWFKGMPTGTPRQP